MKKILVQKGLSKKAKWKDTNYFKLKVKQVKFFKALKNISTKYLANFVNRCCFESYMRF